MFVMEYLDLIDWAKHEIKYGNRIKGNKIYKVAKRLEARRDTYLTGIKRC